MLNTHFGLKTDFKGGAVLIVPFDIKWRSSIYSTQKTSGAVLIVPTILFFPLINY